MSLMILTLFIGKFKFEGYPLFRINNVRILFSEFFFFLIEFGPKDSARHLAPKTRILFFCAEKVQVKNFNLNYCILGFWWNSWFESPRLADQSPFFAQRIPKCFKEFGLCGGQTPASGNGTGFQGQTVVLGFSDVEFRFWRIQRSRSHPQRSFCLLTWFHGFWGKLRVCLPTRVLRIRINHRQFLKATAVSFQTPILPTPSDHPCAC